MSPIKTDNQEVIWGVRKLTDRESNGAIHYLSGLAGISPEKPLIEALSDALDYELWMREKHG